MQGPDKALQFDFDYWSAVAKENPERFEAMRIALVEQIIQQSPDKIKQRMEGLQWRIDQVRNRSANPMAACLHISKMMWDSVLGEYGLLTALETQEKILKPITHPDSSNVIHLNKIEKSDPF